MAELAQIWPLHSPQAGLHLKTSRRDAWAGSRPVLTGGSQFPSPIFRIERYSFPLLLSGSTLSGCDTCRGSCRRWWKTLGLYKRCSCGNVLTKSGVPQWIKAFFRRLAIAQTEQRLLTRQNDLFLCSSWAVKSLGSLVEQCIGGEILQCYSLSNAMEPGGRVTSKKCVHEQNILHAGRTSEAWSFLCPRLYFSWTFAWVRA